MLKKLFIGLMLLAGPVHAAGTVPGFNLTPQFDLLGKLAPGCKLYVIQAGTTSTPQNAYQDSGLTNLQSNPILCDSAGRLPQWFTADGTVKIRLTDKNGTLIFVQDSLLVVGPSSGGGGGGGTVDPTTIIATGDIKARYGTGLLTGYVRANGRTIGSATSGATERANSDCQALFEYLWGADPNNLSVSGGRGISANADWVANKTITLPDMRGRVMAGLDDMGGSSASRLTASYFGSNGTVLGNSGGSESLTLTRAMIPSGITSSGSNSISVAGSNSFSASGVNSFSMSGSNTINVSNGAGNLVYGSTSSSMSPAGGAQLVFVGGASGAASMTGSNSISVSGSPNISVSGSVSITSTGSNSIAVTSNNTGGSSIPTATPTMVITFYQKL